MDYEKLKIAQAVLGPGVSELIEQLQSSGLFDGLSAFNFSLLPETITGRKCHVLMEPSQLPHPLTYLRQLDVAFLTGTVPCTE